MKSPSQVASRSTTPDNSGGENTDSSKCEQKVQNDDRSTQNTPRKRRASTDKYLEEDSSDSRLPKKNRVQSSSSGEDEMDIDKVWAQMKGEQPSFIKKEPLRSMSTEALLEKIQLPSTSAASPKSVSLRSIPKLAELEAKAAEAEKTSKTESVSRKASTSGLEQILSQVRASNNNTSFGSTVVGKSSMLDTSRESWHQFKKDDIIREELDGYKKGRKRYTDRAAFLARTDLREWQFEQSGRKSRR